MYTGVAKNSSTPGTSRNAQHLHWYNKIKNINITIHRFTKNRKHITYSRGNIYMSPRGRDGEGEVKNH